MLALLGSLRRSPLIVPLCTLFLPLLGMAGGFRHVSSALILAAFGCATGLAFFFGQRWLDGR